MDFDAHRLSFGAVAEHYDRVRPTYPRAAVEFALGPAGARGGHGTVHEPPTAGGRGETPAATRQTAWRAQEEATRRRADAITAGGRGETPAATRNSTESKRVLDLGAGTGLLSRAVMALGHEVVAVEPDPGMRARFDAATPGVTALAGSAEEIPLPDASVDAVVAGQAYHWFDRERAHPEIARVLRPGGVFAPMWNDRDVDSEWTMRLNEILRHPFAFEEDASDFGPLFTPIEVAHFKHSVPQTAEGLCELVKSRSFFIVAPPEQQAEILRQVRELTAGLGETFEMPYTTEVKRAFKR